MKTLFRNIHLYLSLVAGLVIMIACLTGAILVFEKELQEIFNQERYYVENPGKRLEITQLVDAVAKQQPEAKLASVRLYTNPLKTVEVGITIPEKDKDSGEKKAPKEKGKTEKEKISQSGTLKPTHIAYVNPYTAQVIEVHSPKKSFFTKTMALHRWLLGSNGGIGKYIVGVSTFLFMFILISGVILWWPKTRRIFLQRINVKWDGNWKRLNHDLHLVFGFYSAIFLFIFAFTAMSWSFEWFNKGIYKVTNTSPILPDPPLSNYDADNSPITIDDAFIAASSVAQQSVYYQLLIPKDSVSVFTVVTLPANVRPNEADTYYIDQFSGKIAGELKHADRNLGQRLRTNIKPLHTASIFGIPSKIIGFIVCLLGCTFPVTGIIMWLNRLKTEKRTLKRI